MQHKPQTGADQGGAQPAATSADSATVQDVVVTAPDQGEQKMMEVMMKQARQGDVVTGTQAQEQQLTTLQDYASKVPGYAANITTPHFSRMGIRGLGTPMAGATSAGYQAETGFVVDGVPWVQGDFQWGDWTNISSFEIGYGPAGTTGGKNTDVGAIYIQTPLPSFVPKTQLETSFGNYSHITEKIDTTGPIIDGRLAYRVTGYYDRASGWIHDILTGQGYNDINRQGIRVQLLATGDNFTDRVIFGYNNAYEWNDYGTGAGSGQAGATIGDSFLVYHNGVVPASYFTTIASRLGKPILTTDPYAPALGKAGPTASRAPTFSNQLDVQLGNYTLTSISAFGYFSNVYSGFSDNQALWVGNGTGDMDSYGLQGSQELRITSPRGERFEWVAGLYADYESNWARMHHSTQGTDAARWYKQPALVAGLTDWYLTNPRDTQLAGYFSGTYHFTDKFTLTAGVRNSYDWRYTTTSYHPQYVSGTPYSNAQQLAALIAAGNPGDVDNGAFTTRHDGTTININPQYQFNDNVLLYSLIGRGDKVASANNFSERKPGDPSQGITPPFSQTTTSWDYEIGAKTNWFDEQVVSNINFYWNDLWNYQTPVSSFYNLANGDLGTITYMGSAPHVRLRGVEFIERFEPKFIPGLQLHASGNYQEARYISYPGASAPLDYASIGIPSVSLSNTRFTGIPWWRANFGYTYSHPVGQVFRSLGDSLRDNSAWTTTSYEAFTYGNLDWYYKTQLTNPRSNFQYWQAPFALVNLGVGLRSEDRNYALTLWVKNLFDARPWSAFSNGSSTTPAAVGLTEYGPRYFGASLLVTL